jgi:hypothetical protein
MYLVLNNELYVHSTTSFDENKRFPIGFKNATNGMFTFTIKVNEFVNFDVDNVYLYDNNTGIYHDIKNASFDINLPIGLHNNRFEITFKNSNLSTNDDVKSNLMISQNNANQMVTVQNPNLLEIKSVTLYDLTGKQIFDKQRLGSQNSYQFSTSGLASSVYLVEVLTSENRKMVQKIIVSSN